MTDRAWVPASCTLPTEERPLRVAEWDALFAERLMSLSRHGSLRLRFELAGGAGVQDAVRDLVEREVGCCSFFAFEVDAGADRIWLDVSVDPAHERVLEAIAVRAGAGGEAQ
ncbi:hypothetical protein [Streptomyces sp. NPDC003635]